MPEVTEFIDPDGTAHTLAVRWDVSGRGMPPIALEEDEVPEQPGSRLRGVRHRARDFALRVKVSGADVRTAVRDLIATVDPIRGDGRIRVTTEAGDQREITCRYQGGLELQERLGETSGPELQLATALFRAHDPYWYALSDVVTEFELSGSGSKWFPLLPLRLSSSELFSEATVVNVGDVEAQPVWELRGPGSVIVLTNLTTGKSLSLSTVLTAGEVVTIDTRRGAKTVILDDGTPDGVDLFEDLGDLDELWPLRRGSNVIRVEMTGATADSYVRLAYRPPYLSA